MSAIGIEIGSRRLRAVAIGPDSAKAVVSRADRAIEKGDPARAARSAVQSVLKELGNGPVAAGVCAHDGADGRVRRAVEAIRELVTVAGDTVAPGVAAAAGEVWAGAARGARTVVALVIGEEISAGILIDGKPWRGAHGLAGSAAWLALNPVERQDYRRTGCLDSEVSSRGVTRRLLWRTEAGDRSAVLEQKGDADALTADDVYDGARAHDAVAISVVRDTAKYIGMAVANLVTTIDPDVIVLCGQVSRAGDLLLDPVKQECARRLPPGLVNAYRLEISPLGEEAAAIGAARLALP